MKRYQADTLNFLKKTQNVCFYRSKHNRSPSDLKKMMTSRKSHEEESPLTKIKTTFNRFSERNKSDSNPDLALREIKRKLTQYLKTNRDQCQVDQRKKSFSFVDIPQKKSDSFRITTFKKTFRHKMHVKEGQSYQRSSLADIQNQFKIKEISIKKRDSFSDPRLYDRIGFDRTFLKLHGETKCFQKAVQFKRTSGIKSIKEKSEKQGLNSGHSGNEISLDYSSDELEVGELNGWQKEGRQLEWSNFNNHLDHDN